MKNVVSSAAFALALALASSPVFADSIVNAYSCKMKEGATKAEIQAINSKWLKFVRENGNEKIESAFGTPVVGDQGMFLFADTYPDLGAWAATQMALDSEAGRAIESQFSAVMECSQNRLWKFEPTP